MGLPWEFCGCLAILPFFLGLSRSRSSSQSHHEPQAILPRLQCRCLPQLYADGEIELMTRCHSVKHLPVSVMSLRVLSVSRHFALVLNRRTSSNSRSFLQAPHNIMIIIQIYVSCLVSVHGWTS
ncbi:hypothetical protein R3P38DRAFT_12132 [Favolaschia claudopus]|uniref:Secreted protein n=1 Tax=Favolaschia claudopus TaxID=2862362 RepID=A0AAW0EGW8_9AGAR